MNFIQEKFTLRGLIIQSDKRKYQILTIDDVMEKEIMKLVKQTMEIIDGISALDCQKLLYGFNWNCDNLLERFSEADSFKGFIKKNKIDLTVSLSSETMLNSFIRSNPSLKRCPNELKGCKKVIKIESTEVDEIICECNFSFCFKCDNIPHPSFPCILIKEWIRQCDEYDLIFGQYDIICPKCFEFYQFENNGYVTCIKCNHTFTTYENDLTERWVFPEYKYSLYLKQKYEMIQMLKNSVKNYEDAEFITTLCKVILNFLQKILPLPIFSFFLDKEDDTKKILTANAMMFEFSFKDLKRILNKIMSVMDDKLKEFNDKEKKAEWEMSDEEQNNILDDLVITQKCLDKLLKFVKNTKEWIFKLPEIQEVYDKGNEESSVDDDDDDDDNVADDNARDVTDNESSNTDIEDEDSEFEIYNSETDDEVEDGPCDDSAF
uniref:IBR domain-containing protein n=1 Tax=Panagrolaimus sp. PS1159 TaxID=55785 RepID=A0AC35GUF8_9BILA